MGVTQLSERVMEVEVDFDVRNVDLDKLAAAAASGGIEALEKIAMTGEFPDTAKTEPGTPEPEKAETDPAATAGESEKPSEATKAETSSDAEDKDHATAVSNRSGTGVIPYAVLKGARERATQFEQENAQLRQQLDALQQQLASGGTPAENAAAAADAAASTETVDAKIAEMQAQVAALKDDFPEFAALLEGQITLLQDTRQQLVTLEAQYAAEREQVQQAKAASVAEEMQDAIDSNPALSLWKEKNGAEWDAAVEVDKFLRSQPDWAGKSFAERFAKVVETVRVLHPEFEVPAAPASPKQKPQPPAVEQKPPVLSLSEIPGGVPPAGDKREQLEQMSAVALGNRFMKMNPDQLAAELAALGM